MAERPRYSIGKPGIDDNRSWDDIRDTLLRSEVEKIELRQTITIPEVRIYLAKTNMKPFDEDIKVVTSTE